MTSSIGMNEHAATFLNKFYALRTCSLLSLSSEQRKNVMIKHFWYRKSSASAEGVSFASITPWISLDGLSTSFSALQVLQFAPELSIVSRLECMWHFVKRRSPNSLTCFWSSMVLHTVRLIVCMISIVFFNGVSGHSMQRSMLFVQVTQDTKHCLRLQSWPSAKKLTGVEFWKYFTTFQYVAM